MRASAPVRHVARPAADQLELDGLELMPCGCVIAIQHANPWPVRAISLEAKGSYCPVSWHRAGRVLRFGDAEDDFDRAAGTFGVGEMPLAMAG